MRTWMHVFVGGLAAGMATGGSGAQAPSPQPSRDRAIYGHVSHVGWVVGDLDEVLSAWRRLGVTDVSAIRDLEMPMQYRGAPVVARFRHAIGRLANAEVHWIEPGGGDNAFSAFLDTHGDGIHHLAFQVPSAAALDREAASFAAAGVPVVQSGSWDTPSGQARFVYLDTAPEGGGITFELEYNPHPRAAPSSPPSNAEPFGTVTQYATLVKDLRSVSRFYERVGFGAIPIDRNVSLDRRFRGQPAGFEMFLGFTRWADVTFEWIEPIVGPSVYDEHLERYGEGFHHLGFNVSDMDAAIAALRARGAEVTMSGGWNTNGHEGRFAYFDTERHGGVALELLWNKPRGN